MRLIDADALKEVFQNEYKVSFAEAINEVIDEQPTIKPERKTGKWQWKEVGIRYVQAQETPIHAYVCSECGARAIKEHNFCYNCGADMRRTKE